MSKTVEYQTAEPEAIYVVTWDNRHRIYVREGQALNWFSKKIAEGKQAKILRYRMDEQVGG